MKKIMLLLLLLTSCSTYKLRETVELTTPETKYRGYGYDYISKNCVDLYTQKEGYFIKLRICNDSLKIKIIGE